MSIDKVNWIFEQVNLKLKTLKVNGGRGGIGFFLGSRKGGGRRPSIYTAINKPSPKKIKINLKMNLLGPK